MINQRKTRYSWTTPCLIRNSRKIFFIMETADEGLPINSNMVTDGFEMVFRWGYYCRLGDTSALKGFSRFITGVMVYPA